MAYFRKLTKEFKNIEIVDAYSGFEENDFQGKYNLNEIGLIKINERLNKLIEKIQNTNTTNLTNK